MPGTNPFTLPRTDTRTIRRGDRVLCYQPDRDAPTDSGWFIAEAVDDGVGSFTPVSMVDGDYSNVYDGGNYPIYLIDALPEGLPPEAYIAAERAGAPPTEEEEEPTISLFLRQMRGEAV